MIIYSLLSLPVAYLLGTIPSAYLVGKYLGKIDIRDEGDGKISSAALHRRVGLAAFLISVVMDIGKALLAVLLAQYAFQAEPWLVLLSGALCIIGHQWSPFIGFRGGLGATVIGGVLVGVVVYPTLIGAACAAVLTWSTKKSSRSFVAGVVIISIVLFAAQHYNIASPTLFTGKTPFWAFSYPILLGLMQLVKALQVKYRPIGGRAQ